MVSIMKHLIFSERCKIREVQPNQELGESIQAHITKWGYSSNTHLMSALVVFYCTLGRIKLGKHVFDEISTKEVICLSSTIKGTE